MKRLQRLSSHLGVKLLYVLPPAIGSAKVTVSRNIATPIRKVTVYKAQRREADYVEVVAQHAV